MCNLTIFNQSFKKCSKIKNGLNINCQFFFQLEHVASLETELSEQKYFVEQLSTQNIELRQELQKFEEISAENVELKDELHNLDSALNDYVTQIRQLKEQISNKYWKDH